MKDSFEKDVREDALVAEGVGHGEGHDQERGEGHGEGHGKGHKEGPCFPLRNLRIGSGMDVHAFEAAFFGKPKRKLIIGGVDIPYSAGLEGHSDADVLTHAVMDALLGALREGDIGQLFPDTDPAYEGANSIKLLERVAALVRESGMMIVDVDCVIAAQAPKMAPYRQQMRENLAAAMGISVDNVGVKATTTEELGFVGRREGILATATCLLARC